MNDWNITKLARTFNRMMDDEAAEFSPELMALAASGRGWLYSLGQHSVFMEPTARARAGKAFDAFAAAYAAERASSQNNGLCASGLARSGPARSGGTEWSKGRDLENQEANRHDEH